MELIILIIVAVATCLLSRFYTFRAEKTKGLDKKSDWAGAFSAFGEAFRRLKNNPAPAAALMVAYLALTLIEMNTIGLGPEYSGLVYLIKLIAFETALALLFLLALPTYGLALADRKRLSIGDFLRFDARKYFAILVAAALFTLATIGSLLFLIVPAIWVVAWFALYEMAIVDKNMGPVQALKESKRLLRNHKGKVWGLIGVSALLAIPAGLLQWIPVIGVVLASVTSQFVVVLSTAAGGLLYRWAQSNEVRFKVQELQENRSLKLLKSGIMT